jgi:phosphocarrier protein
MTKETIIVQAEAGLHARPAGLLAKKAAEFSSNIKLTKEGKDADAKRLLAVLTLGAKKGDTVEIAADGADEVVAVAALKQIIEQA